MIEKKIYQYENRTTYYYPKILGILLSEVLKIPKGNKVDSDIKIPKNLFDIFNDQMKIKFVSAFYECDGDSRNLRIIQAGKSLTEPPNLLLQIKEILQDLGFASVMIKPSSIYSTSKTTRRRWVLYVTKREEKNRFISLFSIKKLSQLNIGNRV